MKATLQQALTGKSLRNDIFNTFHNRSLQSFSPFLKRSRQKDSRYLPYSSQHTFIRSQIESPNLRTDLSSNRYSPSPPHRFRKDEAANNSMQVDRQIKFQRLKKANHSSSKQKKNRKKNGIKSNLKTIKSTNYNSRNKIISQKQSKKSSKSKDKSQERSKSRSSSSKIKSSKNKEKISKKKSKENGDSRLDLSSIIEHQSQQRIITPSSRQGTKRNKSKKSAYPGERTHKKSKFQEKVSEIVCKRIEKISRDSSKYLRLMKNQLISIRYRVQRRKIIELDVHIHKNLGVLSIILEKGNLDCQRIEQKYLKINSNSNITLFSCVRQINLEDPFRLPKIHVEAILQDNSLFERFSTIPYTWMHFTSSINQHRSKKSRIITKTYLQNIQINPQQLRSLGLILPNWSSRYYRNQSRYQSIFKLGEDEIFQLTIKQKRQIWSIQLCGRGEQRLHKLIYFLCEFLC